MDKLPGGRGIHWMKVKTFTAEISFRQDH